MRSYRSSSGSVAAVFALGAAFALGGCSKYVKDDKPYKTIKSRAAFQFDPGQPIEVTADGVVIAVKCNREIVEMYCEKRHQLTGRCDAEDKRAHSEWAVCNQPLPAATLSFGWVAESSGVKRSDTTVLFPIDWSTAQLNPLADDIVDQLTPGVVRIGGHEASVRFDQEAARQAVAQIAREATVDMSVAAESRDVALEVESLRVADGELTAGEANHLIVTVRNRGPGVAYRVSAVLNSSIPGIHKHGAAIGKLAPDQSATVKIPVQVGADVTDRSAMVVVKVTEHNHPQQRSFNQRLKVLAGAIVAVEAGLDCEVAANDAEAVVVAGKAAVVTCAITNKSDKRILSDVEITASMGTSSRKVTLDKAIEPGRSRRISLELLVPADVEGDSTVRVAIAGAAVRPAAATINIKVASGLCGGKKLTQEEYRARRAKLEKAFQAGALSAQEFDRYDAELVSCLK